MNLANSKILFITPPLTQLNTPYPATAYLKGFLNQYDYKSSQIDLSIELILRLFTASKLNEIFSLAKNIPNLPGKYQRMIRIADSYCQTIDPVVRFLQGKDYTLAHRICNTGYLPRGFRFQQMEDLEWAFGTMGTDDQARFLSTLYLEDIGDFIRDVVDSDFGFSRYAERIALTATLFDPINQQLKTKKSIPIKILEDLIHEHINLHKPDIVCITVPFQGNLFGALKCGQTIKKYYPDVKIIIGGGYVNTELRELQDIRVFDYIDYVLLDDGEYPLLRLLKHLEGKEPLNKLIRTFACVDGKVQYINDTESKDIDHTDIGTPDYNGLLLDDYLSIIELINPMHRLWSDGRWNKLTLAHGCYWHKCSFCDTTLDYIKRYSQAPVSTIVDRIESIIEQTGQTGFHFVDEAAPPKLLKELAIVLIRRKVNITWWTNVRFEKNFTADLCKLLALSGCIAVAGGLEVASDRILAMINKGVTLQQVTNVTRNLSQAGIMVHAYLMYGFPTETDQETIDSLEVVRQLFELGLIQSGFWHCFAMTEHSPVGQNPDKYGVKHIGPEKGSFANNDLWHEDPKGGKHEMYSEGLKKSIFNYMRSVGTDYPLQFWFEQDIPKTTIPKNMIERFLDNNQEKYRPTKHLILSAPLVEVQKFNQKGKKQKSMLRLVFATPTSEIKIKVNLKLGNWLHEILSAYTISSPPILFQDFEKNYTENIGNDFSTFIKSSVWKNLNQILLIV